MVFFLQLFKKGGPTMLNKFKNMFKNEKGFTLVEILVVIVIIGILFTVILPRIDFASDKARQTGVKTDFRTFATAAEQYLRETAAKDMTQKGLNTYLDKSNQIPTGTTVIDATGVKVESKKQDPWGKEYEFEIKDPGTSTGQVIVKSYGKTGSTTADFVAGIYYKTGTIETCTTGFDNGGDIKLSGLEANVTGGCGGDIS